MKEEGTYIIHMHTCIVLRLMYIVFIIEIYKTY